MFIKIKHILYNTNKVYSIEYVIDDDAETILNPFRLVFQIATGGLVRSEIIYSTKNHHKFIQIIDAIDKALRTQCNFLDLNEIIYTER